MCTLSFISLSLVWCASPCSAQESPGRWIEFEFTPSTTNIHVKTDSVLRRISDSIRTVNDKLAMMDRLQGDGLQDFLAVWINDSTLSLWISMDSLTSIMNRAMGRRDSTVFGAYDVAVHDWAFPGYIDEPPYPDWYSRDWKRLKKTGVYVNPSSPLQIVWHMDGDSVATFELKLPRARLLAFLGIDSVATSVGPRFIGAIYPDSGSNWATFQTLMLNDSTRSFRLAAGPGITLQPAWSSATKDSLTLFISVDYDVLWYRIRDSVLANAGGGGGATTFAGLTDTPVSYAGQGGNVVSVKMDESGLEFTAASPGGGASAFTDLTDTPSSYSTKGGQFVRVNPAQNGLEFVPTDSLGSVTISNYPAVQSLAVNYDAAMYNYNNYTVNDSWTSLNMDGDPSRKFTNVRVTSTTHVWGRVSGLSRNGYEVGAYDVWGQVTNIGGVIALKSSSVVPLIEDDASWDFRFHVEDTTKIIHFQVRGTNMDTVFWAGQFFVSEVYYFDPQSNWTPAALLGSDSLWAWYDASRHTLKFTESLGDTTWVIPDHSGRDHHAIRTATPKYVYNDSSYYGAAATSYGGYTITSTTGTYMPTQAHCFIVSERSTSAANGIGTFNIPSNSLLSTPGLGEQFLRNAGTTIEVGVPFVGTSGRPYIVENILTADSLYGYCNGIAGGRATQRGATMVSAGYFLLNSGATVTTNGFRGNFKEMVIVRGKNLTEPDRVRMLTYLRLKHRI